MPNRRRTIRVVLSLTLASLSLGSWPLVHNTSVLRFILLFPTTAHTILFKVREFTKRQGLGNKLLLACTNGGDGEER